MNKNYIFVGVGIAAAVIILAIIFSQNLTVSPMTLDEIIKNRDCKALQEWELDHSFDASLDITSKQMTEGVQLAMECTGKALDNMMDTSSSDQSDESDNNNSKNEEQMNIVINAIQNKNCQNVLDWTVKSSFRSVGFDNNEIIDLLDYVLYCQTFAIMDKNGIDTYGKWDKYSTWDKK